MVNNKTVDESVYSMKDYYKSRNLVIGNLSYISNQSDAYEPMVITTAQKYIFETIDDEDSIKYQEIFTGFVASEEDLQFFNLPCVVNIERLSDKIENLSDEISKYAMLLVLDEINKPVKLYKSKSKRFN